MRVNIFRIPQTDIEPMRTKLVASQMEAIKAVQQDGWAGTFYFSTNPTLTPVRWVETYGEYFEGSSVPTNRNYYAAFVFTKSTQCYVISYGKAHFYLRPFCDYDFGIEVAKRIANESDIRQTASRRFQGRRKKYIRSFAYNTRLDIESGESVDYLQAAVVAECCETFGSVGKFGSSVLLTPDIEPSGLGKLMDSLDSQLATEPRFALPRTTLISEPEEIERYDKILLDELTSDIGTTDFVHNSYDLYGVDFVFSSEGQFTLSCPSYPRQTLEKLDMKALKLYITNNRIARDNVLRIKVRHEPQDASGYTQGVKEALDFIADDDRVLLTNGRWMHFNQDYLDFLDDFLREIKVEDSEPEFREISVTEPAFNISDTVREAGYEVADRDFSIFKTRASTPIEAWDLRKGSSVYAVKFGTAQKLGYVCDQATALLELLRNKAGIRQVPNFESYCLWLGYRCQRQLDDITETGSIILKQKIETWARRARDLGIEPVIKLSRKVNPEYDA
jgi:uncharacterized protein (TIGR04141 family)